MIQQVAKQRREQQDKFRTRFGGGNDGGGDGDNPSIPGIESSPVKTVLGALAQHRAAPAAGPVYKGHGNNANLGNNLVPKSIEDVPFRRQDKRILNARKKRVMDKQLIKCIIIMGILMALVGVALVTAWWMFHKGT